MLFRIINLKINSKKITTKNVKISKIRHLVFQVSPNSLYAWLILDEQILTLDMPSVALISFIFFIFI